MPRRKGITDLSAEEQLVVMAQEETDPDQKELLMRTAAFSLVRKVFKEAKGAE